MARSLSIPILSNTRQLADARALGQTVRVQRLMAGLRIDDAAALCGISVTVLSRLENATSSITTRNLFKVLDGLGLSLFAFPSEEIPKVLATQRQSEEG